MHPALGAITALLFADISVWVWGVIIAFWVVSSIIGAIRQGAKKVVQSAESSATALEQSPTGRRLAGATQQMGDDARADLNQSSTDLSTRSLGPAQAVDVGKELLAQIQAARQAAATLTVRASRGASASAPSVVTSADQALAATLSNVLDMRGAQSESTSLPAPVQHHVGIQGLPALLHGPGGLAFAVLSATVIGPCTALKTVPQEPGGW
jgi:hypothetical protein